MTVSYQYDVASSTSWGFIRLLFRWRGSVWKLVYREFFVFGCFYVFLAMLYRLALTDFQKQIFEMIVYYSATVERMIPLSFILGFYVSFTATRWWNQYTAIPWPDKLMNIIALYAQGVDDGSRMVRRTLLRYVNLSLVLVLRSISMAVKRRFPTKDHLVEAGFMTKPELEMFQAVPSTEFNTFWIPCTWFINLLREARQDCRITDSNGLKLIMEELNEFRSKCGLLWSYDWISIPLVYTQVVTMATYAFFMASVVGRQFITSSDPVINAAHRFDYYVPFFTILQFFFYMGLLKVAEQLVNPFGDDDEDFELNWMIDRHLKVSYLGVDTLNCGPPPLMKDSYFHETDIKLPYTEASLEYKKRTYRGSVANMHVPTNQQNLFVPEISESDEDAADDAPMLGARRASTWTIAGGKVIGGSVTNLAGSIMGDGDSMESVFRPMDEPPLPSWTAAAEAAVDVAFSTSGTSGGSPRGGATSTSEEAMDRLEPPGYVRTPPHRTYSNSGQRPSPSRRSDQPLQIASLRGIIRRFKQPAKHYPKQFTVRPYYATAAEGATTPTKGVTFSPECKKSAEKLPEEPKPQASPDVSIPVEPDPAPDPDVPSSPEKNQSTPSPRGSITSSGQRRRSLDVLVSSVADPTPREDSWLRHNSLPNVQEYAALLEDDEPETERSVSGMIEHEMVDDLLLELPLFEDSATGAVTIIDPGIILPDNETNREGQSLAEDEVMCYVSLR